MQTVLLGYTARALAPWDSQSTQHSEFSTSVISYHCCSFFVLLPVDQRGISPNTKVPLVFENLL